MVETKSLHLSMAIKSPTELNTFLGNSLPEHTMRLLTDARKKKMPFFVTPYYLSLFESHRRRLRRCHHSYLHPLFAGVGGYLRNNQGLGEGGYRGGWQAQCSRMDASRRT